MKKSKIILGIESSCDETSVAVVRASESRIQNPEFRILSNVVLSQVKIHKQYGGVVPEVAARNHIVNIIPVLNQALREAKLTLDEIDRIAVTRGPGLITSLLVGVETTRTLAYTLKRPMVGVDHIKAHAYAAYLQNSEFRIKNRVIRFPALALIVSGGHTELLLMKNATSFKKIGQTLDDAAGEAFDKVAKMMNLGFPGGPHLAKLAGKGNPEAFDFPRGMLHSKNYDFSFSGLKTSVLYTLQKLKPTTYNLKPNISASFQQAVVDVLVTKTMRAAEGHKVKTLILGGGVSANASLRQHMASAAKKIRVPLIVPDVKLCTDNAAAIAAAGYFEQPTSWQKIEVDPNLGR